MIKMKGAEAIIKFEDDKVIKERIPKPYRDEEFDRKIRIKRTKREAKIMEKLKNVINVPKIIKVEDFKIIMEKVEGRLLKDLDIRDIEFWKNLGKEISKIHKENIIHGDLTTKNILIKENQIFFIDFGLSFYSTKIEDKAMDLIVLKDILTLENREEYFKFILEGYESPDKENILDRLKKIEERGRYKRKSYKLKS